MRSEEFAAQLSRPRVVEKTRTERDVRLSEKEVEEWLRVFEKGEDDR